MIVNGSEPLQQPRSTAVLAVLGLIFTTVFIGLISLGVWQLQRLHWKLDLIERVETRIHAPATPAPTPSEWPHVTRARDEYRHVLLQGRFLPGQDTHTQAVTTLGSGFWVLSPFQLDDGSIVLVNRGFIPNGWRENIPLPSTSEVTGLLRISEPGGGFLRQNKPAEERWYSRDVAAIAAARNLKNVAPFFVDADFVDADAMPNSTDWPRAGLTVTRFSNNHLGYALTWFALALMVLWGGWRVAREERRLRQLRAAD